MTSDASPSASGDVGREAVYAAELAAFEGTSFESLAPWADLDALATAITSSSWWPHGPIPFVAARRDARSSSTRVAGDQGPVVRLAAPQATPATLVHEFAHVLAGVEHGHGPTFRRAHIDIVRHVFGEEPAHWLFEAYDAVGLELGARTWRSPVPDRVEGDGFVIV